VTTTIPGDLAQVRYAFRLGWAVSELRGRYRPDRFNCPIPPTPGNPPQAALDAGRREHQLPLAAERGLGEIRIEIREAIGGLVQALKLELAAYKEFEKKLFEFERNKRQAATAAWPTFANLFYKLDAEIQDGLLVPAAQAAAYQLGRAVSDTFWALDTTRGNAQWGSWQFVLGKERCQAIKRTTLRLSGYLDTSVVAAIRGPLDSWSNYAQHQPGEKIETIQGIPPELVLPTLNKQGVLWRDLIRGERLVRDLHDDPDTPTAENQDLWRRLSLYQTAIRPVIWPLVFGALGVAALILGAWYLGNGTARTGLTTAITILGGLGLTSASLYATAKARIFGLRSSIQQALVTERARQEADLLKTITPPDKRTVRSEIRAIHDQSPSPQ
jgi:hypothetical protein